MIKIKTITKPFLVVLFLFSSLFASAQMNVTMRMLNTEGSELEQAQIGKPFILDIYVSGARGGVFELKVEGTEGFAVKSSGSQVNSANGYVSVRYPYFMRIDSRGSHSIGPAVARDDSGTTQSDVLIIKVGNEEIVKDGGAVKQKKEMILLIEADQNEYVVGQKIEGTLTFLFSKKIDHLFGVTAPNIENFTIDENLMKQSAMEFEGKQYSCVTWDWHLFIEQSGEFVIPSCCVDFSTRARRVSSFFLSFQPERRRIYSNVLTVNVQPLPPHEELVDAVGVFQNFEIGLNQAAAKEGDGIVVELSIEGDADFEHLNLELQNIPYVFKSYSSKQKIAETKDGHMQKKSCEYIIQGMEVGEWKIPEQKFTYYDTETFSYKTLRTASLLVKILPQSSKKYMQQSIDYNSIATSIDAEGVAHGDDLPLDTNGRWYEVPERKMPWWLFFVLFFAPLMIWLSDFVRRFFRRYSDWRAPQNQWKNAFNRAQKKIEWAKKQEDFPALYRIFIELFAIRCSIKASLLSDEKIEAILLERGFSQKQIQEWTKFFAELSAFIFYTVHKSDQQNKLFGQANEWILTLKDVI